jgi:DNA-binding MarR family transcriptional regulator
MAKKSNHSISNKSIIDSDHYSYVNIEEVFLSSIAVINLKIGKEVSLTADDKNLYIFMRKRYAFFQEVEEGREEKYKKHERFYYPNQDDLAEDIGATLSTVKRGLKKLESIGLIEIGKSGRSNFYKVNSITPEEFTFLRKYKGEIVSFDEWKSRTKSKEVAVSANSPEWIPPLSVYDEPVPLYPNHFHEYYEDPDFPF